MKLNNLNTFAPEYLTILSAIKDNIDINALRDIEKKIKLEKSDFSKVKEDTKHFYSEYFSISNVVYYPKNIPRFFKSRVHNKIESLEQVSPFDVPITEITVDEINGAVYGGNFDRKSGSTDRLVRYISISNCSISRELYAHEIAHTQQLISDNDSINSEVISIFIELLMEDYYQDSKDMFYFRQLCLLNNLVSFNNTYLEENQLDCWCKESSLKYISSTLKAYKLYYLCKCGYFDSIINDINRVFDRNLNINDLLNKYNINSSTGSDGISYGKSLSLIK